MTIESLRQFIRKIFERLFTLLQKAVEGGTQTARSWNIRKPKIDFNIALILLSLTGILSAIYLIIRSSWQLPSALPISPPAPSVYDNFIAATGIVESSTDNIQLSTQVSGIVRTIHVKVGHRVKKGDPLFTLDTRTAEADLKLKEAQVDQARATLKQAKAQMNTSKDKYDLANRVKDKRAISKDDFLARKNAYLTDKAAYEAAGEALKTAEANLHTTKVNLEILTVHAPIDCQVLQVNVHPGELASQSPLTGNYIAAPANTPLMLLGGSKDMHVRIDIDENQAWRFTNGTRAIAYLRGNSSIKLSLKFVRSEPYVVPKTSLTGLSTERVDTRVLQVIYAFDPQDLPVFIGQQVDVYVDVPIEHDQKYAPPLVKKDKKS